jgi:Protein of unknown function (DUF2909)
MMLMKIIAVVLLLAVVASLFSGLYFLQKDKGNSTRAVKALTVRVVLSLTVFLFLMVSYYFGWFPAK